MAGSCLWGSSCGIRVSQIRVGLILDGAEHFDYSQGPRLGLCWPVALRARQSIREARGEALTPLFEPSGGTLSLALRGCGRPKRVCAPVSSVETRASFQQAPTNAAGAIRAGEERSCSRGWDVHGAGGSLVSCECGRGRGKSDYKWQNVVGFHYVHVVRSTEKHTLLHKRP